MDTFQWTPSDAKLLLEDSLIASKVQFGGRYAQVSYRGLIRIWDVLFDHSIAVGNLRDVITWLDERNQFLWVQPGPYDTEGPVPTRWSLRMRSETNGVPRMASYDFTVELEGPKFQKMASEKYGSRDTGTRRVSK